MEALAQAETTKIIGKYKPEYDITLEIRFNWSAIVVVASSITVLAVTWKLWKKR